MIKRECNKTYMRDDIPKCEEMIRNKKNKKKIYICVGWLAGRLDGCCCTRPVQPACFLFGNKQKKSHRMNWSSSYTCFCHPRFRFPLFVCVLRFNFALATRQTYTHTKSHTSRCYWGKILKLKFVKKIYKNRISAILLIHPAQKKEEWMTQTTTRNKE